ncbi:Catenin alpha-2 [Holothuria leucospilota]|uniref:Catenin alpha-2 n=1 Tax=Holothuria leucospilota TaxID=206669 RepID=A0A9Q0YR92_HOLLE|nr:Catenin alpha-2 [Holothuria leucospilota]
MASTTTVSPTGTLSLQWDPKNLEIRTFSVEKTLEPLVTQVTTLVNTRTSSMKKGRSKKAHVLVAAVVKATEKFVERGEEIAPEIPQIKEDILKAVDEVKKTGEEMREASSDFADDPCSSMKRGAMVRAARALLSAVTRLLILADMVDIHLLLNSLMDVEDDLERIKQSRSQQELTGNFKAFGKNMMEFNELTARRQNDLKDPRRRDEMAAARADLRKHSAMLFTASKAYLRHPDVPAARENRDFVVKQMEDAMNAISSATQATGASQPDMTIEGTGELIAAIDDLDRSLMMNPLDYNEVRTRPSLEERLESIISGAALMADSSCTRDNRRDKIVAECNAVRQALQDLLSEYMNCAQAGKERSDPLDDAIDKMYKKTKDLRRQLRKAVVDHVSDSFMETNVPILILIEAAKSGNEREVEEYAKVFQDHANKLVEVANLACSMSNDEEGVKMVRMAASQIETLCPQVINAARTLAARPRSKAALDNMDVFKVQWEGGVRLLTEAVDDITTIEYFLAVSEGHILEDVNQCVMALQMSDPDSLDRTAANIQGRSARICTVVDAEMLNYEPGLYTQQVNDAVLVLKDQVIPSFSNMVDVAVQALGTNPPRDVDENEFIDASRMVYDGVREIRRTVLMNRPLDEIETDSEDYEEDQAYDNRSGTSFHTETEEALPAGVTSRAVMRKLPEEAKEKIQEQVELFRIEKAKLDQEMAKWDDSGNDIIILAREMCMIMMEMTDFTRGKGPLKSTMDVISAAKKIADAGSKLDKLARDIADQCPHSASKEDLIAYLQQIALYCHQLNITSKVKAEIQSISGEIVVSGLESATSLIQAAKNLMAAVVLTVKASYVASTKYKRKSGIDLQVVQWKMKAPEKKPLIPKEAPAEMEARIRKSAKKKDINPVQALSEFRENADFS